MYQFAPVAVDDAIESFHRRRIEMVEVISVLGSGNEEGACSLARINGSHMMAFVGSATKCMLIEQGV